MPEPEAQPDGRLDLTPLFHKARDGDENAFARLMDHVCPGIAGVLRRQGVTADDAEDAVGDARIAVLKELRKGTFRETTTGGFIAYMRKVAFHAFLHRPEVRKGIHVESLTDFNSETGDTSGRDVKDTSATPDEIAVRRDLHGFLMQQLRLVFIASRSGSDRLRGQMELLAFVSFYQDGRTQNQIYEMITDVSQNFPEMTPVTHADLNNWLSMGRSLKALLRHLADNHRDVTAMLVDLHLDSLNLDATTREVVRLAFLEEMSLEDIAKSVALEPTEVKRILAAGKRDLVDGFARTIKIQLKAARSG